MPRFYFDSAAGEMTSRDEEGLVLPDLDRAKSEAVASLPDLVREAGDMHRPGWTISSRVRTETGQVVFQATLSFRAEEVSEPPLRR